MISEAYQKEYLSYIKEFNSGGGPIFISEDFEFLDEGIKHIIYFDTNKRLTREIIFSYNMNVYEMVSFLFKEIKLLLEEHRIEFLLLTGNKQFLNFIEGR